MTKKVIYIIQPLKPENVAAIAALAPDYEVICAWETDIAAERLKDIEIIIGGNGPFTNRVLDTPGHCLKWVQVHSAGIDYLDLPRLQAEGILLSNTSGLHGRPIAEHVIAVLLAKTRAIRESILNQGTKTWNRVVDYDDLDAKSMLILGAGRVGSEIAKLASAFGIKVTGVNLEGKPIPYFDSVVLMDQLDQVLPGKDIVVNILPLTAATKHFCNADFFAKLEPGATFISCGRGPTVVTADLIEAISSGQIGYACLDVFETEPLPADSPLWTLKNTLITAHIAGQVPHFKTKATAIYTENLAAFLKDGTLARNQINYANGF
ncbi:NAD(P)-dependent oxidoreductase [Lacticaseibacillus suihuaensis]